MSRWTISRRWWPIFAIMALAAAGGFGEWRNVRSHQTPPINNAALLESGGTAKSNSRESIPKNQQVDDQTQSAESKPATPPMLPPAKDVKPQGDSQQKDDALKIERTADKASITAENLVKSTDNLAKSSKTLANYTLALVIVGALQLVVFAGQLYMFFRQLGFMKRASMTNP